MNKPIKFLQKNGLTAYSLACGNIQRAAHIVGADFELRVDLYHDGSCYHVRAHEHGGRGRLMWESFEKLGDARQAWRYAVVLYHGARIAAAKADRRYAVAQEFVGERAPYWVARFDTGRDSWIGKSQTEQGAWLLAAADKDQREGANHE